MTVTKITTLLISKINRKIYNMITGILPKGFVYLHVNNMSRYPRKKRKGIGINEQKFVVFQIKTPEETQHNLLPKTREGQLHGSMQSKLESVMEVGKEDC
jgi:hypothetical protein